MNKLIVCVANEDDFIKSLDVNSRIFQDSDDFVAFREMLVELFSFFLKEFFNTRAERKGQLALLPKTNCMLPFHKKTIGTNAWIYGAFYLKIMGEHNYLCIISTQIQGQNSQLAVENYAKQYSLDLAQSGDMEIFSNNAIFGLREGGGIWKAEISYEQA